MTKTQKTDLDSLNKPALVALTERLAQAYGTKAHKALTGAARKTKPELRGLAEELIERAGKGKVVHLGSMGEAACGAESSIALCPLPITLDGPAVTCQGCRKEAGLDEVLDTAAEDAQVEACAKAKATREESRARAAEIPAEGLNVFMKDKATGGVIEARLNADGTVDVPDDQVYPNVSAAASAIAGSRRNGWVTWRFVEDGQTYSIDTLRGAAKTPVARRKVADPEAAKAKATARAESGRQRLLRKLDGLNARAAVLHEKLAVAAGRVELVNTQIAEIENELKDSAETPAPELQDVRS